MARSLAWRNQIERASHSTLFLASSPRPTTAPTTAVVAGSNSLGRVPERAPSQPRPRVTRLLRTPRAARFAARSTARTHHVVDVPAETAPAAAIAFKSAPTGRMRQAPSTLKPVIAATGSTAGN